jgi:hypothetical protein
MLAGDLNANTVWNSADSNPSGEKLEFTTSAYRLSASKVKLSELNTDIPGLDRLLKHKQGLRKL